MDELVKKILNDERYFFLTTLDFIYLIKQFIKAEATIKIDPFVYRVKPTLQDRYNLREIHSYGELQSDDYAEAALNISQRLNDLRRIRVGQQIPF